MIDMHSHVLWNADDGKVYGRSYEVNGTGGERGDFGTHCDIT